MEFMQASSLNRIPQDQHAQRQCSSINEQPYRRNAFDQGMWILDSKVVEGEHAMERFHEEEDQHVEAKEGGEAYIIRSIRSLCENQPISSGRSHQQHRSVSYRHTCQSRATAPKQPRR